MNDDARALDGHAGRANRSSNFRAAQGALIMAGTLLECGTVRTPEGEVPSIALAAHPRRADGTRRRTNMRARTGEDRETILVGAECRASERLTDVTVRELIAGIRIPAGK